MKPFCHFCYMYDKRLRRKKWTSNRTHCLKEKLEFSNFNTFLYSHDCLMEHKIKQQLLQILENF